MKNNIIVYDYETGSLDRDDNCCPIQVAAIVMDGMTLDIIPADKGGEFCSMMKPVLYERIQEDALAVNKKSRAEILKAPEEAVVWANFCSFVGKWNPTGKKWDAPVAAGHNIINFDNPITQSLCRRHKSKSYPFNEVDVLDTKLMTFLWFENTPKRIKNHKLDTLRDFLGMSKENAHDALQDCKDCAAILSRYLRLYRGYAPRVKFEGACKAA